MQIVALGSGGDGWATSAEAGGGGSAEEVGFEDHRALAFPVLRETLRALASNTTAHDNEPEPEYGISPLDALACRLSTASRLSARPFAAAPHRPFIFPQKPLDFAPGHALRPGHQCLGLLAAVGQWLSQPRQRVRCRRYPAGPKGPELHGIQVCTVPTALSRCCAPLWHLKHVRVILL
jgi:hypothetical protein